jgi:predicted nucleic acid-binding Zn ribbon protein
MPTYSFIDTETGEEFDLIMKWSEREEFLKEHIYIKPLVTSAGIVSGVSITGKVPDGFKEVLSKVAENHKTSSVAENHAKKSIKETRTRELVEKYYNKQKKNAI